MEMCSTGEKENVLEIAVAFRRREVKESKGDDCIEILVDEFKKSGLVVERVLGLQHEFLKLGAPLETIGRAAAELQLRKQTQIGLELPFEWDKCEAFAKQPDGSLFNWTERFRCYNHIISRIVNESKKPITLSSGEKELRWESGEPLIWKLKSENIVKEIFPLHDERKRKQLLRSWALNFWDFTMQPIDEIYLYFGSKIATYFGFLGMYTKWLLFPAISGLTVQFLDFGGFQLLVFPGFFLSVVSWAALFFQFWKRRNATHRTRWKISNLRSENLVDKFSHPGEMIKNVSHDKPERKNQAEKQEWLGLVMRFRNDAIMILSIICLQLPFELAYAHIYEATRSNLIRYALTTIYLLTVQYFNKIGGKISVNLTEKESSDGPEYKASSLVYKVFGLYFMQSYIGLFYHLFLHRNFLTLRQVLVQRLIVSQVLQNVMETTWPYLTFSYKKYKTYRKKRKNEKESLESKSRAIPRVEKEYLKPTYSASVGDEIEDGLFDDFLELAVQFGAIMMFACVLPSSFALALLNNLTEIRTDSLKLLVVYKRPVPRSSATIGAWLNVFQFLIVMSICTNSILLVCLYDQQGKWKIEPGLAAILVMEHVLLLIKYLLSRLVPEEPAWMKADRASNIREAQEVCSKEILQRSSRNAEKSETDSTSWELEMSPNKKRS